MLDQCDSCKATGLPLLPLRYAPVPATVALKIPAWAKGQKVTDVDIGPDYHYALRSIRGGYIYIYHTTHPEGANHWECFSVTHDGKVRKQPSPDLAVPPEFDGKCTRKHHSDVRMEFLVIAQAHKCTDSWIAFSEHKWTEATRKNYQTDKTLREARMQAINPAALLADANGTNPHAAPADKNNISTAIEYSPSFDPASFVFNAPLGMISKGEDGSYDEIKVTKQPTLYPINQRDASRLFAPMRSHGITEDGRPTSGVVFALWDAVGMAQELNGFRNAPAGWLDLYGKERELQISGANALDAVQKMLERRAADESRNASEVGMFRWTSENTKKRMETAKIRYANDPSRLKREADLCRRWEIDGQQKIPAFVANRRAQYRLVTTEAEWQAGMAEVDKQAAMYTTPNKTTGKSSVQAREERSQVWEKEGMARAWPKYQQKLHERTLTKFNNNWKKMLTAVDALIDARTTPLIKWLEATQFINTLEDFDTTNIKDGIAFHDTVSDVIFGMNSSKSGAKKIDEWVKQAEAGKKGNLIWRALALNQDIAIKDIDAAMKTALSQKSQPGQLTLQFLGAHVKKWADIYKKANTMMNTWNKAANPAEGIKQIRNTRVDRFFLTVGDKLMSGFVQQGSDWAAEYVVKSLVLVRADVEPNRILAAVEAEAKLQHLERSKILTRLAQAETFLGAEGVIEDIRKAKSQELTKKWAELKATPEKGEQAIKENRLSLVVATLELINLGRLVADLSNSSAKHKDKIIGELCASAASTTAALLDVAANPAKHLIGDKVSKTFQYLKVTGGFLSAGAGYYSMVLDFGKFSKNHDKERYFLAVSYGCKAFAQFFSTTFGLLASISYAAPLLTSAESKVAQAIGKKLLYRRLFFMTWGVRLNMIGIAITLAVWFFSDDALQDWCEESPFGERRAKGPQNSVELMSGLEKALAEIL